MLALGICIGIIGIVMMSIGIALPQLSLAVVGLIGIFIGLGLGSISYNKKLENKPENVKLKEEKINALQEKLSVCQIEKTFEIPFDWTKNYYIGVSTKTKQIVFYSLIQRFSDEDNFKSISFEDIIGCELLEDNETIQKGGVGRAVVGGILAGGVGAIVGATTRKTQGVVNSLKVKLVLNNILNPYFEINIITTQTSRNDEKYQTLYMLAQEIYSTILSIEHSTNSEKAEQTAPTNNIDELRKYKQLFDEGIISKEEFEGKKKQILNL